MQREDMSRSLTLPRSPNSRLRSNRLPSPLLMSPTRLKAEAGRDGVGAESSVPRAPFQEAPLLAQHLKHHEIMKHHAKPEAVIYGSTDYFDWKNSGRQFVLADSSPGKEVTTLAKEKDGGLLVRVNAKIADSSAFKGEVAPPTVASKPRRRRASMSKFLAREYVARKTIQKFDASETIVAELRKGTWPSWRCSELAPVTVAVGISRC